MHRPTPYDLEVLDAATLSHRRYLPTGSDGQDDSDDRDDDDDD